MENKIKRKTLVYATAAILIVAAIATLAYNIGIHDKQTETPSPVSTPLSGLLAAFPSQDAIKTFLTSNSKTQGPFPFYGPEDVVRITEAVPSFNEKVSSPGLVSGFSGTNVQVAGVDEADIVKTDGEYMYVLSGNSLFILKAYPPQAAEQVAKIGFDDLTPIGMFVNGDRLTVLGSKDFIPAAVPYGFYTIDIKTFARVYDVHNRTNPALLYDFMFTGSYFNSRMVGDYVYFVVSQPAYVIYDTVILPKIYMSGHLVKEIAPSEIRYSNGSDNYYQYTTLVALNMMNITEAPTYLPMMLGGTSSMYASLSNMYVTFPSMGGNTTVYRVHIAGSNMTEEATGQVLGRELNQFSMDEHNGYFRIATASQASWNPRSNLFILDMNLSTVGKLLDIEVGENLDSARFIENRCYLSTSVVKMDPFFVIDVENVSAPEILGYLKIPGFNRYLHPYDENHVIGVGRDEFNKVKISLFDVSNVSAPEVISEYKFSGDWSNTEALTDHKAFLFAHDKDLLAIPVAVNYYDVGYYKNQQGLFVFNITLSEGLVLKGNVTHQEPTTEYWNSSYYVKRGLYIEDTLYTVSDKKIKLNSLQDLMLLREILLS